MLVRQSIRECTLNMAYAEIGHDNAGCLAEVDQPLHLIIRQMVVQVTATGDTHAGMHNMIILLLLPGVRNLFQSCVPRGRVPVMTSAARMAAM